MGRFPRATVIVMNSTKDWRRKPSSAKLTHWNFELELVFELGLSQIHFPGKHKAALKCKHLSLFLSLEAKPWLVD